MCRDPQGQHVYTAIGLAGRDIHRPRCRGAVIRNPPSSHIGAWLCGSFPFCTRRRRKRRSIRSRRWMKPRSRRKRQPNGWTQPLDFCARKIAGLAAARTGAFFFFFCPPYWPRFDPFKNIARHRCRQTSDFPSTKIQWLRPTVGCRFLLDLGFIHLRERIDVVCVSCERNDPSSMRQYGCLVDFE